MGDEDEKRDVSNLFLFKGAVFRAANLPLARAAVKSWNRSSFFLEERLFFMTSRTHPTQKTIFEQEVNDLGSSAKRVKGQIQT